MSIERNTKTSNEKLNVINHKFEELNEHITNYFKHISNYGRTTGFCFDRLTSNSFWRNNLALITIKLIN